MTDIILMVIFLFISYLLGSIPFGYIFGKIKGVDIRKKGSGNIGSTNTFRVLGLKVGLCAALLDIFKGSVIIMLVYILEKNGLFNNPINIFNRSIYIIYGFMAVLGHDFTCYLGFHGGKGVATSLGVLFAINPIMALIAIVVFIIFVITTRFVGLSSTMGAISALIFASIYYGIKGDLITILFVILMTLLIVIKHIPNYIRMAKGEEGKIF